MILRVVTADDAARRDAAAIAAGVPSRALMQRAGAAAAQEIARRYRERLTNGVAVYAGPGNNGGDAWVLAAALGVAGVRVAVSATDPRSDDARAEREHALAAHAFDAVSGAEGVAVDGLLGTGASGAPRGEVAALMHVMRQHRGRGAPLVALDVPSGLDATTGNDAHAVAADLTITFGTLKRGLLLARDVAGEIVVVDIGLGVHNDLDDGAPVLVQGADVRHAAAPFAADAHKGTRGRIAFVGGAEGLAGATMLAAAAALRSGAGMTRLVVDDASLPAVQSKALASTAVRWPRDDEAAGAIGRWAHALCVGPGLGLTSSSAAVLDRMLGAFRGPVVLDADALTHAAGQLDAARQWLAARAAVLTPHVVECGRLAGEPPERVEEERFDIGLSLARSLGAVVLLKGTPTVISAPDGRVAISASGNPALATAGSGDVLSGIITVLLAQTGDPFLAATSGAWVHGRAAEIVGRERGVRGATLEDVLAALPRVWQEPLPAPEPPVLARLPRVETA
jgi:ADP-dependent NAD(P)H-hydrate dehydratase / NAD(P)H-hydrate epimerase